MYTKNKPTAIFSSNLNSPTFVTQNSTVITTPSLTSPFSIEKNLSPLLPGTPDRKSSKSDIVYLSRNELDREFHNFVNMIVQQKAVNENDITQYLDQLKKQVISLTKENARLLASPISASNEMNGNVHREGELVKQIEEMENQKGFYEERIKSHSLHIVKLEQKINELVQQCQGLMRINHEMSAQMLQLTQLTNIFPANIGQDQGGNVSEKINQLLFNNQTLNEENFHLKNQINHLRQNTLRLENGAKIEIIQNREEKILQTVLPGENNESQSNLHLQEKVNQLQETVFKLETDLKKEKLKSMSFKGDPDFGSQTEQSPTFDENLQLKAEVDNLKEIISNFKVQLKESENSRAEIEISERAQRGSERDPKGAHTRSESASSRTFNGGIAFSQLMEENKKLRESLEQKENLLKEIREEEERAQQDQISKSLNHLVWEDGSKTIREEMLLAKVGREEAPKTTRDRSESRISNFDLLKKQIGDYKAANVILQKKNEKYLLQIEDLNAALRQANENLDTLQNKYITLEKELVNKNRLETIMNTHINLISKLEVKINGLTEENSLLQKANEENIVMITELRSQLEEPTSQSYRDLGSGQRFNTPPRSGRRASELQSCVSPTRSPDTIALEREIIKKKYDVQVQKVLHENDMEMRAERIKHKNQIEKYNMNLDVLSRKIQALVAVNEELGNDFEMLKVEFTNYRTLSWSIIQEIRKYMDNFKRHDHLIENTFAKLEKGNDNIVELKEAYEGLKADLLCIDEVIEERRKHL